MKMKKKKIILICSDGGHLAQILELKELFVQYDYLLITEETDATVALKDKYNIKFLKGRPKGERGLMFWFSILSNMFLSLRLLITHYPKVIITTGSHTAVPMAILGKLFFVKVVWILSFARINSKAKSASLIYPIADKFIVQWETAQQLYPKSIYLGGIY
jgi:UDP-N-acetylglucosamine:LPS N-acetylglucosamine transferase